MAQADENLEEQAVTADQRSLLVYDNLLFTEINALAIFKQSFQNKIM